MKYVIIGASAAAVGAVATIRAAGDESEIVVVSKDDRIYSRCMLHKLIDGERSVESINFAGKDYFEKNNVRWEKGRSVTAVNPDGKTIMLEDQSGIVYDKLLIASGAVTFIPPVNHLRDCQGVLGLHDLPDAEQIKQRVENGVREIVVVGAGLIGMDAVSALVHYDVTIHVIEMADRLLPLQLDEHVASVYQKKFEEHGVRFYLSGKLTDVVLDAAQQPRAVALEDGTVIPCDLIIAASGVRPNIQFLDGSGIKTEKGIVVDAHMRTSQKDVYAAGDVTGLSGTWEAARRQGQTAARRMMGVDGEAYTGEAVAKNTMNFFHLPALSVGCVLPPDDSYETVIRQKGALY
ncbi:MAG: FAD-dependent oxidoreductase, partial [Clostridiales bacterium]|nr:FAD-dependent oxidoreductase [Clostridiales bacterium]